jgi:integrase
MPIRKIKTKNGDLRYQVTVQDLRRGIPRTRRNFKTREEAKDWEAAVYRDARNYLLGRRQRRLFGQALAKYLTEISPYKKAHYADLENAIALRWPVRYEQRWITLEHLPIEPNPEAPAELWLIPALSAWEIDMLGVLKRAYLGHELYLLRNNAAGQPAWFHQPAPGNDPRPRCAVTDKDLIRRLNTTKGRGPYSPNTLRTRQALVSSVLTAAYKKWDWLESDQARRISFIPKAKGRQLFLTYDQLRDLVIHAPIGFDRAILAAAWIGWRRGNIIGSKGRGKKHAIEGLTWARVVFPIYEIDDQGNKNKIQMGLLWVDGDETKNSETIAQPMSQRVEQLLQLCWQDRNGALVFHRGDGKPYGDIRKIFNTAKRRAGIPAEFRWHDLRHTFASHMVQAGVTDRHLQELGGWRDAKMVQNYAHLRVEHLQEAVEKPGGMRHDERH